jgi:predicted unusual protein kinase regulating ubiquinone biosynthesis (AarF/ABC1/UbiB family)
MARRSHGDLVFVDFGMTGRIDQNIFAGLREAVIAVGTRDAGSPDQVLPNAEYIYCPELICACSKKPLPRRSIVFGDAHHQNSCKMGPEQMREFATRVWRLLYEMPFQLPENMILLGRCLSILNGMCTGLDPNFNFWTRLEPYARRLISDDESGSWWEFWLREIGEIVRTAVSLPRRIDNLVNRIEQGELEVRSPDLKNAMVRVEQSQRKLAWAVLCAAFLLGATQFFLADELFLSIALAFFAFGALIFVILR